MIKMAKYFAVLALFATLAFLFFYKLDYTALESYDEAWYAGISKNLAESKNPLELEFNRSRFTDHPPAVYILMAIPHALIDNMELSARIVPAFMGLMTIIFIYLVGNILGGRLVGISAAIILLSSMWFMVRARSGNLDIPFLFFSILSVYGYLKIKQQKWGIYLGTTAFALLILSKTLAGAGLLPVIAVILWQKRKSISFRTFLLNIVLFSFIVMPWYAYNQATDSSFLHHHFVDIAGRNGENSFSVATIKRSLYYIQIGIGKWNKIFYASFLSAGLLWILSKESRSKLFVILALFSGFAVPLLSSSLVEIWHLIPLYLSIALLIAYSWIALAREIQRRLSKNLFAPLIISVLFIILGLYQFKQFSNLLYFKERVFSTEKAISQKAAIYDHVYLMEVFYPAAVYYSDSKITQLRLAPDAYQQMVNLLTGENVFIVNRSLISDLERDKVSFEILDNSGEYFLIK